MTLFFTANDGTRLAYSDVGEGPALLCLAGLTRTTKDFDYVAPHLVGLRVIRMDYRGRGQSGWSGALSYTVAQEGADALALLDHLSVAKAAILGTSRGGLIGMVMAALARERLLGLCLNDVGPVLCAAGLERIKAYVGRAPRALGHDDLAARLPKLMRGFANVPPARWREEVERHYTEVKVEAGCGLKINYDPALRDAFLAGYEAPPFDAWPLFDGLAGLPLALIWGANSDLLTEETAAEMRRRRPDMIFASVADRGHIPFLDEPEALIALAGFLKAIA
jgi:pimeloyl-ACP methyl ester carboxylesterase